MAKTTLNQKGIAMSYIYEAFKQVCDQSKPAKTWYVCLCTNQRCYGGAEEGGWWYDRGELLEYQAFNNEDTANEVAEKVRKVAEELSLDSKRQHGEAMLASMEWLDARGLDADYLPEPNGEEEYYVMVTDSLPQFSNETPHYE